MDTNENRTSFEVKEKVGKKTFSQKIKDYFLPKGIQVDRLRYRPNKACYNFGLLACLFLCLAFACQYSGTGISDSPIILLGKEVKAGPLTGIDIVINILLLLFRLTSSITRKNYSKSGSIGAIIRGVINIARSSFFPLALLSGKVRGATLYTCILCFYVIAGVLLILAGLLTFFRGSTLRAYLKTVKPIENEKGN